MSQILINNVKYVAALMVISSLLLFANGVSAVTNTQSMDFEESSDQYLSISDASQTGLDITGDISIEAWVKLEQLPSVIGNYVRIVNKDNDSTQRSYSLGIGTGNKLLFQFTDGSNWTTRETTDPLFTSDDVGRWVHVAVTADVSAAASGVKMYIDGEATTMNIQGNSATSINNSSADFEIGSMSSTNQSFDGLIDEVRVWNDVRSQSEIQDNMFETLAGSESGLAGYWELNGTSTDSTSNGNTLTLNNSPSYSEEIPHQLECSTGSQTFNVWDFAIDVSCTLSTWF